MAAESTLSLALARISAETVEDQYRPHHYRIEFDADDSAYPWQIIDTRTGETVARNSRLALSSRLLATMAEFDRDYCGACVVGNPRGHTCTDAGLPQYAGPTDADERIAEYRMSASTDR